MPDAFPITGRPVVQPQQDANQTLAVLARQPSQGGPTPAADNGLQGLISGLSAFNPALQEWSQRQQQEQRAAALDQARADAQKVEHPVDALTGAPVSVPSTVPPAYGAEYRRAFGMNLADRAALDTRQQMSTAYEEQKHAEDFNLDNFLQGWRQTALKGVTDPTLQGAIGAHLTETEQSIRSDYTGLVIQRHDDSRNATAFQLADAFTGDKTPAELAQLNFDWFVPRLAGMGVDKKQASALFLQRLSTLSNAGNGRPELFDAMDAHDSEGLSVIARNPQLAGAVEEARKVATAMRDKKMHEDTEVARFKWLAAVNDDVMNRPETVTDDRLISEIGPNGISVEQAVSLRSAAQTNLAKHAMSGDLIDHAQKGELGMFDKGQQESFLEERLSTSTQALWDAARVQQDPDKVLTLADQLMQAQSRYGATVPVPSLKRFIDSAVSTLPRQQGPDAGFQAAALIYRAMSTVPRYRDMYFQGDAEKVIQSYTKHLPGNDPGTAYQVALRTVDPEVLAANRARAADPKMQAEISKKAMKAVDGSSWFPRWLGGNGRPENAQRVGIWAAGEVMLKLAESPDLTDDELADHVSREAARNWVLDTTSNLAVKVPPGYANQNLQQAVVEYSQAMAARLKSEGKWPDDAHIEYAPDGTEGSYRVRAMLGARTMDVGPVSAQQVIDRRNAAHILTPAEGSQVFAYKQALAAGKDLPAIDPALIAKATSAKYLQEGELRLLEDRRRNDFLARLRQTPGMGLGAPTGDYTELPRRGSATTDNQLTSKVASDLAFGGYGGGFGNPINIASSLIAMREGVSLQAYNDPAKGAGMNIGAGYNLNAHAGHAMADFAPGVDTRSRPTAADRDLAAAGVPVDRIEAVKAGRAQLTTDQAKRLLQVSVTKYGADAHKEAEAASPGLWDRMLPTQKAVMIDLAYQTGNAGQFKNAWAALARGDTEAFSKEVMTTFRNPQGEQIEDKRGMELRRSVLAGEAYWKARLGIAAGRPSTTLQSAAQEAAATQAGAK